MLHLPTAPVTHCMTEKIPDRSYSSFPPLSPPFLSDARGSLTRDRVMQAGSHVLTAAAAARRILPGLSPAPLMEGEAGDDDGGSGGGGVQGEYLSHSQSMLVDAVSAAYSVLDPAGQDALSGEPLG